MISRQFLYSFLFAIFSLTVGTVGYPLVIDYEITFIDSLYMTVITLSTIGYSEIVNLDNNPGGRLFTMFLIVIGMGNLVFFLTSLTSLVTNGKINNYLIWRYKMKKIKKLNDHFILCGAGRIGRHILSELINNNKQVVVIDNKQEKFDVLEKNGLFSNRPNITTLLGDVNDDQILLTAGVETANSVICCLDDDRNNLLLTVSVKNLNSKCLVHSRVIEIHNQAKFYNVGADCVVSPQYIGGLRLASEAMRPHVVSFLDEMLRASTHRIDEVTVQENSSLIGKSLEEINFHKHIKCTPITIITKGHYNYSPHGKTVIKAHDILIFIATPDHLDSIHHFINKTKKAG